MTHISTLLTSVLLGSLVDLDGTLFIQLALFFLLFFVLRALVFKPMLALFEAREKAIDGAREDAKRMEREAKDQGGQFDEEIRKVKVSAGEERDRLRQDGLSLEKALLERVRHETDGLLAESKTKLDEQAAAVRRDLNVQVPVVAKAMASKLLGREV